MLHSLESTTPLRGRLSGELHQVLLLVQAQWSLIWKRPLTQVLAWILLGSFIITIGFHLVLFALATLPASNDNCTAATQNATKSQNETPCLVLTPQQKAQQQSIKIELLHEQQQILAFPGSLGLAGADMLSIGVLLFCILVASVVGSEYHYGTQVVAFSRGVRRYHLFTAQAVTFGLIAVALTVASLLGSSLTGFIFGPVVGGHIAWPSLQGWGEIALYGLTLTMCLWMYSLLTLFITTLGRSVSMGMAGIVGYLALQALLLPSLIPIISSLPKGFLTPVFQQIPTLFLSTMSKTLLSMTTSNPIALSSPQNLSSHAVVQLGVVWGCYVILTVGASLLLLQKREPGA